MNKTKGLFFTASLVLALTITQSCSGDDGGGGGGDPSSSSGGGEPSGGGNACTNLEPVTIGSQKWAKKNLDCEVGESKCYENNSANCTKYGRLYDWATAMTACPSGWHLPTNDDWDILVNHAGGSSVAGGKLKANSGWNDDEGTSGNGTDSYGFTALPGGLGTTDGVFDKIGNVGGWWIATEYNSNSANQRYIRNSGENIRSDNWSDWNFSYGAPLFSVRCIKD